MHKHCYPHLHVIMVMIFAWDVNKCSGMQAQRQALAAQFRSATQHVYAQLKEQR